MTIGLFGGLTLGAAFYVFNRPEFDRSPRSTTVLEQIFGTGLTLWFAVGIVILGAWEGFIRVHRLEDSFESTRTSAFYAYLAVASLVWLLWSIRCIGHRSSAGGGQTTRAPISVSVLVGLLIVIVVSGYLPSVPGADNARLALLLLLFFYMLFVIGSAICAMLFVRRRTRS